jgi:hypothetical protein
MFSTLRLTGRASCSLLGLGLGRSPPAALTSIRSNVTYSGGHASVGQGGFYGSGGSRTLNDRQLEDLKHGRDEACAHVGDVDTLKAVVLEIEGIEDEISSALTADDDKMKVIELKAKLKKTVTHPKVMVVLNKLEYKGAPVWGLSERELEVVNFLRSKVNEC